ncbi:MAG: BolA family protein [Maricaulaceae bacterium]|jgi:BolA protein
MTQTEQRIRSILSQTFDPAELVVEDDSARHAGHAGARPGGGTHFNVKIVADAFAGLTPVARHRKVNDALADEFARGLHALSIVAKAPDEVQGEG